MFLTSQSVRYCKRRTGVGDHHQSGSWFLKVGIHFSAIPLYCGHKGREFLIVRFFTIYRHRIKYRGQVARSCILTASYPDVGVSSRNLATFFILMSVIHEKRAIYLLKLLVECIYLQLTWNRWLLSAGWSPQRYVLFRLHVFSRSANN